MGGGGGGGGGDFDSDEAKTRGKRTKEQVQAKNRNKYKTRTETRTTPHNQTRRQAGGFASNTHPQFFRTFGGCLDTCIVYTGKRNWETKLQNITQNFDDPLTTWGCGFTFGSWPQGKELLHPSGGAR